MFNFDFSSLWDFSNMDLSSLSTPEINYDALANLAVQVAVTSPAVVNTPANVAPSAPAVQAAVEKVITAIAPDDSDERLRQIARQATQAVVKSPEVIAAPAGQTVTPAAVNKIVNTVVATPVVDELTKKAGAAASVAAAQSVGIPTSAAPTQPVPGVTTTTPAPAAVTTPLAGLKKDSAPSTATPIVDEQTRAAAMRAAAPTASSSEPDPTKTAYADLTPAQRAAMTEKEKTDYLAAAREFKMAQDATARATTDPMNNFAIRPAAPPPAPGMINYYAWIGGVNSGSWKLYQAPDTPENQAKYGSRAFGGATQATAESAVGANALINPPVYNPVTGTYTAPTTTTPTTTTPTTTTPTTTTPTTTTPTTTTPTTATPTTTIVPGSGALSTTGTTRTAFDAFKNTLALFFGPTEIGKPWVSELYNTVSGFTKSGSTPEEAFNMALLESENNPAMTDFTKRFKGIFALQKLKQQGRAVEVPTVAEYFKTQETMGNLLKSSNLGELANEDYLGDVIGKAVSATEFSNRLVSVFDRIDNASDINKKTISRFFPTLDRTQLAKALLTGEKGAKQLQQELAGYEVLAGAEQQGLGVSPTLLSGITNEQAQQIARGGGTYASTLGQFGQISQARETEQKLAEISGVKSMGVAGLTSAVIGKSAKELKALEDLTRQEEARYMGKAGTSPTALRSQSRAAGII
jgi:hypothetical protein